MGVVNRHRDDLTQRQLLVTELCWGTGIQQQSGSFLLVKGPANLQPYHIMQSVFFWVGVLFALVAPWVEGWIWDIGFPSLLCWGEGGCNGDATGSSSNCEQTPKLEGLHPSRNTNQELRLGRAKSSWFSST